MKSEFEVFELIHSLSKSEKRYIKLNSVNKGNGVILSMMEAIEKFKGNNEQNFRQKHKNEKFLKNYSYNKFYLYKFIIKKLTEYNNEKSIDGKIHTMIMESKILFAKALYRQYFKSLQKAKSCALRYERYGYYLQILEMEKIIIKKEELQSHKVESIYGEAVDAISHLKKSFDVSRISGKLLYNFRGHGLKRDKEFEDSINKILSNKVLASNPENLSSKEKEAYYRIFEIAYEIKSDYEKALVMQKNRLGAIQSNPEPFKDCIINYEHDVIFSIINSTLILKKLDETEKYLAMYADVSLKAGSDKIDCEITTTNAKFQICMMKADYRTGLKYVHELEKILTLYKNKLLIDTELSIRYFLTVFFIMSGDFENALTRSNVLLSHPLLEKRGDYASYLKILNLIIHYELGNYELLKHLIKSTYRYLYKRSKLYKLETILMDFIRKLPEVKNDDDFKFSLIKLKKKFTELLKDPYEKNAFIYFDFLRWLEPKLT